MTHTRLQGSNQYKYKYGLSLESRYSIAQVMIAIAVLLLLFHKPAVISPCPDNSCQVNTVVLADTRPELQQITDYILYVFRSEPRAIQVRALACFISESGLRPEATNHNTNGTTDYSIPQINSIHIQRFGNGFITNWKQSIDIAYQIYKERGFSAWYGGSCN